MVFDQSDFSLIGVHDLDFRVELWDADFSTQHADAAAVAGEPVSVEMSDSGVPAPLQPTLAAPSETSMVLSLADDGGPADTVYCALVVSSPVDASRNGNYIWPFEGLGQRFDAPVWKPLDAWQNLLVTNPALKSNTTYSFMARAKLDGAESAYGAAASLATLAAPPGQCMVPGVSAVSMSIAIDPADNPGRTLFAIKCMATDPADSRYDQRWIDACGYPACDPEWQTALQWLSTGAAGLRPLTTYTFA
ncbi:MAG: hypothetical protein HQ592_08740, partial [Planctomycetes bacterium]|nr:hypothetical protein [Planctomycetota bacterium]